MESDVTYAELRFPQTALPGRRGPVAEVRTTVTTPGKTPVSSPASTKWVRTLAILSIILLVLVITFLVLSIRWSNQLQSRTAEMMECSANATILSGKLMYVSKQWDTSQQHLTHLLSEQAEMTKLYQNLSVSFQSTNETLQDLMEQQRKASERWTQMMSWLELQTLFHCSSEDMSGHTVVRCRSCQKEWTLQNPHCYFFSQDTKTWGASRNWCEFHQSRLVSVNSHAEQRFINSRSQSSFDKFWIGYSDSQNEDQWLWEDGSATTQLNKFWKIGQPDNFGTGENCATTEQTGNLYSWNDDNCMRQLKYICERDADQVLFNSTGVFYYTPATSNPLSRTLG